MGAVIFAGVASGLGVAVVVLFALWLTRRRPSVDDDLMDLAASLANPRTRMPAEPSAEARACGAQVRIPKHHEEV